MLFTVGAGCAADRGYATTGKTMDATGGSTVEIIAHRGASHHAPENTLAAVERAWEMGADGVEFDVRLTRDGQLVAMHDANTKRTAGTNLIVAETPLAALQQLDVGRWKGEAFAGEAAPTIDEVLATVPRGGEDAAQKRIFVEVKVGPASVEPLLAALERANLPAQRTPVISFNYDTCREVKRRRPELPVYLLSGFKENDQGEQEPTIDELISQAKEADLNGLNLSFKGPIDATTVERIKAAGLGIYVWTVDDPAVARRLIEAGVEGITTNRPDLMLELPEAQSGSAQEEASR